MTRAVALMAELSEDYKYVWNDLWQGAGPLGRWPELRRTSPKISRGENCEGLPYVVLDYPRVFGRADAFAIRTLFWWGREWQLILYMKGGYWRGVSADDAVFAGVGGAGFRAAMGKDIPGDPSVDGRSGRGGGEWAHGMENYAPVGDWTKDMIGQADWCKLALAIDMGEWNGMRQLMGHRFTELVGLLNGR